MARTQDRGLSEPAIEDRPGVGDRVKLGAGLLSAGALLLFLLQNLQEVDVNFLWFSWSTRLLFALVVSAVLGAVTTMLVGFFRRRAQDAEMRQQLALERERGKKKQ